MFRKISAIASLTTLSILSGCNRYPEKLNYTIVVAGDDRLAPEDTVGNSSTTNTYHLKRLFAEIAQLNPLPKYLIFNGDLVMGYTNDDTIRLARELREWIKIYKESPLAKTTVELVALPGNHEIVEKEGSGRISFASHERTFVREMKDYIHGDNGPHATTFIPGTDSLMSDQSKLTYSFDYGGDHFVILNTDPVARENRIPWRWLKNDLESAHTAGARHIFLFAHKPPYQSHYVSEAGMEEFKANRDSAWDVIEKYNCDIYFGSHYHLWDTIQVHKGKTWEVVCGNSGAPLDTTWHASYYGFTIVNISNNIDITSMGHNVDMKHYMDPTPSTETVVKAKLTIIHQ